jgi:hypothetical protein
VLWRRNVRRAGTVDPARILGGLRPLERPLLVMLGRWLAPGDPRILGDVLIGGLRLP